jgi:hypothetical protein
MLPLDQDVNSSGAEEVVLARLCLDSNKASDRPTVSSLRPLDHPVLLSSLVLLCNSFGASRNWTVDSSDGVNFVWPVASVPTTPTLCIDGAVGLSDGVLFFSLLGFDPRKIDYLLNLACRIFASLGLRNVYKDMLNNIVSLIDHVVMKHQNHTRTNGI